MNLSTTSKVILYELSNSSTCIDGKIVSDELSHSDEEVNEMLWEVYGILKEELR